MHLQKDEIEKLERTYKLNLINSLSGVKPANLIGTKSKDGKDNVAIFSSVVHLGSSPAQLAFIMRPQSEIPRDTYPNILETEFYTINHVSESFIEKAHFTSAKLERGESEFDRMKLEKEFIAGFHAPFVKDSPVKIGMKHLESIPLPNGCLFVIGSVEMLVLPDEAINDLGQLDLQHSSSIGISGLNTYYGLTRLASFPYVREEEIPDFE
ncbi:flavin reductase family protein [Algoriphagus aquimarinus]|uniref:flavin reductase family protein n=1 Tax=Algoriphagus aquimarinus TaxID=237018 RepID=UPI0030D85055|tara:strand:- start:131067 stop:131696 length:630 start_codon:yes stop_codon:yes gene_type:complete